MIKVQFKSQFCTSFVQHRSWNGVKLARDKWGTRRTPIASPTPVLTIKQKQNQSQLQLSERCTAARASLGQFVRYRHRGWLQENTEHREEDTYVAQLCPFETTFSLLTAFFVHLCFYTIHSFCFSIVLLLSHVVPHHFTLFYPSSLTVSSLHIRTSFLYQGKFFSFQ